MLMGQKKCIFFIFFTFFQNSSADRLVTGFAQLQIFFCFTKKFLLNRFNRFPQPVADAIRLHIFLGMAAQFMTMEDVGGWTMKLLPVVFSVFPVDWAISIV